MPRGGKRPGAGRKKKDLASIATVVDKPKLPTTADIVAAVPEDALEALLKTLPADVSAHGLLKAVIQSPQVPGPIRLHAAAKVLPYEVAKPSGTAQAGSGGIVFKLSRHGAPND